MGRSNVGSGQTRPESIKPARGKIGLDDCERLFSTSGRSDGCDIFQEQESRSNRIGDAQDFAVET